MVRLLFVHFESFTVVFASHMHGITHKQTNNPETIRFQIDDIALSLSLFPFAIHVHRKCKEGIDLNDKKANKTGIKSFYNCRLFFLCHFAKRDQRSTEAWLLFSRKGSAAWYLVRHSTCWMIHFPFSCIVLFNFSDCFPRAQMIGFRLSSLPFWLPRVNVLEAHAYRNIKYHFFLSFSAKCFSLYIFCMWNLQHATVLFSLFNPSHLQ